MNPFAINAVVNVNVVGELTGTFRVIAYHYQSGAVFLARLDVHESSKRQTSPPLIKAPRVTVVTGDWLRTHQATQLAREIELNFSDAPKRSPSALTGSAKTIFEKRERAMQPFLDNARLAVALSSGLRLGPLVDEAMRRGPMARSDVYRNWSLLCRYGLVAKSLTPAWERCGAKNVSRPSAAGGRKRSGRRSAAETLAGARLQCGISAPQRGSIVSIIRGMPRPWPAFRDIYDNVVDTLFAERYDVVDGELTAVLPPPSEYPNQRQIRHIFESELAAIERFEKRTTELHFIRNHRPLTGRSRNGVFGPGHTIAVDSTIADIYLRSEINRQWYVGRPVLYIFVDVWSQAIVGFHVCLMGPSWPMVKQGLFSMWAASEFVARIRGHAVDTGLSPAPSIPAKLRCDRGEYLSNGATETAAAFGFNMEYNAAYRPDLKGIVERLHRIAKERQFRFAPGSIDARRRERDLRTDKCDSRMSLRAYTCFLFNIFREYNLTPRKKLTFSQQQLATGDYFSPASLWQFGHDIGRGYRKVVDQNTLITSLLPASPLTFGDRGALQHRLQYLLPEEMNAKELAHGRNLGRFSRDAHYFPNSPGQIWLPGDDTPMIELSLSTDAPITPACTIDEFVDAERYQLIKRGRAEHAATQARLDSRARNRKIVEEEERATMEAESCSLGEKRPPEKIVRKHEHHNTGQEHAPLGSGAPEDANDDESGYDSYAEMMRDFLAQSEATAA